MATTHTEELVQVQTADGIFHEGVVIRPATDARQPIAVLWVHGLTGRFYGAAPVGVGRGLARRGYTLVSGNNRGHDIGAPLRRGAEASILDGKAWEKFDESPHDVAA